MQNFKSLLLTLSGSRRYSLNKFDFPSCPVFNISFIYFRFEVDVGLQINEPKPKTPLPKDVLCQIYCTLAQWFWRNRCEKFMPDG